MKLQYMALENMVDPITGYKLLKGQVVTGYALLTRYRGLKSTNFQCVSCGIATSPISLSVEKDSTGFESFYNPTKFTF